MKNKFIPLSLLFPLLAGCSGGNPYAGKYTFQLGKDKETHIGIYLELTDNPFVKDGVTKGKEYHLNMDMTSDNPDTGASMFGFLNDFTVDGYYNVKQKQHIKGNTVLSIGMDFLGEVEIPSELTEYIFAATINDKQVNFIIPVSVEDLNYQLYWYGFDITLERLEEITKTGEDFDIHDIADLDHLNAIGSHPTKEQVDEINLTYPDKHNGKLFRDYHTLSMGLLKK